MAVLNVVGVSKFSLSPYSIWESEGTSVSQVMVALEVVMVTVSMAEIVTGNIGAGGSGVLPPPPPDADSVVKE